MGGRSFYGLAVALACLALPATGEIVTETRAGERSRSKWSHPRDHEATRSKPKSDSLRRMLRRAK